MQNKSNAHLRVMYTDNIGVLVSQVSRDTVHGYLHRGHRRVVERGVCHPSSLFRKPHSAVRAKYLLCERNNDKRDFST